MVKNSLVALFLLISLAYVISAPASNDDALEVESPVEGEVEDVQSSKKTKRGIYGLGYGYGLGHSFYPHYGYYGGFGHGYGYGHYPYYSLGYHGYGHYGHGYGGYGHLW